MLYEKYEIKVAKFARFLKFVLKHLTKIIISASVVLATTVALVATKGIIVSAESFPTEIQYGDDIECSASAFLSTVYYEYSPDGEDDWSTDVPKLPGT